jgi:hypothetical protein
VEAATAGPRIRIFEPERDLEQGVERKLER